MIETDSLTLIGAGDHARVIVSLLKAVGIKIQAILDDDPELHGKSLSGVTIAGPAERRILSGPCFIAIGSNQVRKKIDQAFRGGEFPALIHPTAVIDESVTIGPGSVVMAGAIIQPGAQIGRHVIVNTGAVIEHDCIIDDYVHIASNTTLAGRVRIGEGVFLGAGTTVIDQKQIGAWAVVGAGACVVHPIPGHCTAVGVPAKPVRYHNHA